MDAFFESCAMRAEQLTRAKQAWLQMQVSTLMYNAEFMDDSGQPQPVFSIFHQAGSALPHQPMHPVTTATTTSVFSRFHQAISSYPTNKCIP